MVLGAARVIDCENLNVLFMNENTHAATQTLSEGHSQGFALTGYGWLMVVVAILSVLLTYKFLSKKSDNSFDNTVKPKTGCLSFGYVFLVIFSIATLALGAIGMFVNSIHNIVSLPRYEATIIGHDSYQSESKDSKGRSRSTTMYTPILQFTDVDGNLREVKADLSSGGKAAVGSTMTIGYRSGMDDAEVISSTKYFMLLGLATMMFIMVYVLVLGIVYSFGWSTKILLKIGAGFLMYYLFPAGMILLFWGCAYHGLYKHFTGQRHDMPVWAIVLCSIFSVTLFFVLIGWARMLLGKSIGGETGISRRAILKGNKR